MNKHHPKIDTGRPATLDEAVEIARAEDAALSDIALARVGNRLFATKVTLPQPRNLLGLRFATLMLLLLLGGAAGAAATFITLRVVSPQSGSTSRAMEVTALPGSHRQTRAIRTTPVQEPPLPTPAVAPADEITAPAPSTPATSVARPSRPWAPVTPAPETAVTREARQLAGALDRLRKDHRPKDALVALDAYLRDNPRGAFTDEAHMARAEALAATGDRMRAIAELKALAARKPAMREKLNKLIDTL